MFPLVWTAPRNIITLADITLDSNTTSALGYGFRILVPTSEYDIAWSGVVGVRVTLTPASSGNNAAVVSTYLGHPATPPSFDGNQVQLLWGGSATLALTAGGAPAVSDWALFDLDSSKDLILALGFSADSDLRSNTSVANADTYYKEAASGESGDTTVSGYSTTGTADQIRGVDKIEFSTLNA